MALREITISFDHFSPGDVEANVTFVDTIGVREERTFMGRNESEILQAVSVATPGIVDELMARP